MAEWACLKGLDEQVDLIWKDRVQCDYLWLISSTFCTGGQPVGRDPGESTLWPRRGTVENLSIVRALLFSPRPHPPTDTPNPGPGLIGPELAELGG